MLSSFRLNSKDRVKTIADENSFVEFDINMEAKDPLNFPDYKTKIKSVQEKTGLKDAIRTGKCTIGEIRNSFSCYGLYFPYGFKATLISAVLVIIATMYS